MSRILRRFRGGAVPKAPPAYSSRQAWVSLVVPLLALGVDALAFYPVLAIVLPSLRWYFLVPVAAGLAAGAVYLSDRVGLGWRQRRANDPTRSDVLTVGLLVLWTAAGVGMFLARLFLGSGQVSLDAVVPVAGSARDTFGAVTFAVLYLFSGAIAMAAAYWLYRPARDELAKATAELNAANEQERSCEAAAAELSDQAVEAGRAAKRKQTGEPERRTGERHRTDMVVWHLKIFARHSMAATVPDPRGRALSPFMENAPAKPQAPEGWQ